MFLLNIRVAEPPGWSWSQELGLEKRRWGWRGSRDVWGRCRCCWRGWTTAGNVQVWDLLWFRTVRKSRTTQIAGPVLNWPLPAPGATRGLGRGQLEHEGRRKVVRDAHRQSVVVTLRLVHLREERAVVGELEVVLFEPVLLPWVAVNVDLLRRWEVVAVMVDRVIKSNNVLHEGRGRRRVRLMWGWIWEMRRGVRKELGSLWHYRGGGKGHLLLVGCRLVVHVSKAVVQVVVRVVVDLGGDDRAHEGRLVRHTWQGTPASRRSRWEKSSGRVGCAEGRVAPTWSVRFHHLHIVNNASYISRKINSITSIFNLLTLRNLSFVFG